MALPALAELRSIRAQAYIILAWGHLQKEKVPHLKRLEAVAWSASQRLVECYQRSRRADWPWFESRLTYANAVLPHALFVAADCWSSDELQEVAVSTFDFLEVEENADPKELIFSGPNAKMICTWKAPDIIED